jgi:hypothetical protein
MANTPKEYALKVSEFKPLYEPLGALVMAFADLEATLTFTIDALMGLTHPEGRALEVLMVSFSARIQLFHTLALMHTRGKALQDEIPDLISRLDLAYTKRNDLVHGAWSIISKNGDFFGKIKYRAKGGLKQNERVHKVSTDDVWDAHKFIFVTSLKLAKWRDTFNRSHYPPGVWRPVRFPFSDK